MSINIRTNIGPAMGGLSEHGTFRNSMYQQQEQEKKEKQLRENRQNNKNKEKNDI